MIVPLIFKNDDTATSKSKTGKVTTPLARALYSYSLAGKVGILEDYGNECNAVASNNVSTNMCTITLHKGMLSVYGGVIYIEEGTTFNIDTTNDTTTGSFGVKVDLGAGAGNEVSFYAETNPTQMKRDNLQDKENDGVYYFELYKYTISSKILTLGTKTANLLPAISKYLDGTRVVPRSRSVEPQNQTTRSTTFYVGNKLVYLGW